MTFVPNKNEILCFAPCDSAKIQSGLCSCSNRIQNDAINAKEEVIKKWKESGLLDDLSLLENTDSIELFEHKLTKKVHPSIISNPDIKSENQ